MYQIETGTTSLLIAVSFIGHGVIVSQPPQLIDDILDCSSSNDIPGTPTEPGVYSCTVEYTIRHENGKVDYDYDNTLKIVEIQKITDFGLEKPACSK
jgi:hypothetical protein